MTLSLANMLPIIGQAWISTKAPFMGTLVAKGKLAEFESVFFTLLKQSTVVVLLGGCMLAILPFFLGDISIFERVLPPQQIAVLALSSVITHLVNCLAQYLRSFKKEPMMGVSIVGAVLISSLSWFFGKKFSSEGIVVSALTVNLFFGLPSALWLWLKYKRIWGAQVI